MHKFFHLIILYIALASPTFLRAQESFTNRYNTIYITMNEGLPNNFVTALPLNKKLKVEFMVFE